MKRPTRPRDLVPLCGMDFRHSRPPPNSFTFGPSVLPIGMRSPKLAPLEDTDETSQGACASETAACAPFERMNMAKKPILTDDELDGGLPSASPPPPPGANSSVTRPVGGPAAPAGGAATRIVEDAEADAPMPAQQQGRDASGHARPKTRIHGLGNDAAKAEPAMDGTMDMSDVVPVVGWLVVTAGPGRGASVQLTAGMNAVGRGPDNAAQVDFGDDTISQDAHAFVTYDSETRLFHLSHGGKTNIVRRNDAPVLTAETLDHGDVIRIGDTSLRFVALCGPDFDWANA